MLLGYRIDHLTKELNEFGAQNIYLAQHKLLDHYQMNTYAKVIAQMVTAQRPAILLIGATTIGPDLAPRVSMHLKCGITAGCTGLTLDPATKSSLQTRSAFDGNIIATIKTLYIKP